MAGRSSEVTRRHRKAVARSTSHYQNVVYGRSQPENEWLEWAGARKTRYVGIGPWPGVNLVAFLRVAVPLCAVACLVVHFL
tara:strand:+ start:62 stop:304 length:243 start_codon:yes stop_codon:yes gene_type:complete